MTTSTEAAQASLSKLHLRYQHDYHRVLDHLADQRKAALASVITRLSRLRFGSPDASGSGSGSGPTGSPTHPQPPHPPLSPSRTHSRQPSDSETTRVPPPLTCIAPILGMRSPTHLSPSSTFPSFDVKEFSQSHSRSQSGIFAREASFNSIKEAAGALAAKLSPKGAAAVETQRSSGLLPRPVSDSLRVLATGGPASSVPSSVPSSHSSSPTAVIRPSPLQATPQATPQTSSSSSPTPGGGTSVGGGTSAGGGGLVSIQHRPVFPGSSTSASDPHSPIRTKTDALEALRRIYSRNAVLSHRQPAPDSRHADPAKESQPRTHYVNRSRLPASHGTPGLPVVFQGSVSGTGPDYSTTTSNRRNSAHLSSLNSSVPHNKASASAASLDDVPYVSIPEPAAAAAEALPQPSPSGGTGPGRGAVPGGHLKPQLLISAPSDESVGDASAIEASHTQRPQPDSLNDSRNDGPNEKGKDLEAEFGRSRRGTLPPPPARSDTLVLIEGPNPDDELILVSQATEDLDPEAEAATEAEAVLESRSPLLDVCDAEQNSDGPNSKPAQAEPGVGAVQTSMAISELSNSASSPLHRPFPSNGFLSSSEAISTPSASLTASFIERRGGSSISAGPSALNTADVSFDPSSDLAATQQPSRSRAGPPPPPVGLPTVLTTAKQQAVATLSRIYSNFSLPTHDVADK